MSVVVNDSSDVVRMIIWGQAGNVLGPRCRRLFLRSCGGGIRRRDLKNSRNGFKSKVIGEMLRIMARIVVTGKRN